MNLPSDDRQRQLALYVIETGATVRSAAKRFGLSKSTVHKDITQRLKGVDYPLYLQVRQVLERNKRERHIRGGLATREKYAHLRGSTKNKIDREDGN